MENKDIRQELADVHGDELLFADGYDSAIIGVSVGHQSGRVVYSTSKMIEACMEWADSYEDAVEWLEFNTFNAYVGDNTPIYIDTELLQDSYKEDRG